MNKTFLAAGAAALAMLFSVGPACADEKPLIWQPSKNSDTSYSVKVGIKLPTAIESRAGFDVGVDTTKGGAVVDTPLRFWSSLKTDSIQRPAYEMNRDIDFDFDGVAGSAGISVNYYEKHIATTAIDIERQSNYALRYDGTAQQWSGVSASQSVKVSRSKTGTAVVMRATGADNFKVAGAGLGLEQKFGDHMMVSGSFDRNTSSSDPVASVNARYAFTW